MGSPSKAAITEKLAVIGIAGGRRAETLSIEEFGAMYRAFQL